MFKGVEVPEHSLVVSGTVGTANADTLMCESDYSPCCTDTENVWWFDFDQTIHVTMAPGHGWIQTRDTGVVRLHYYGGTAEGIFFCRIRVSGSELQTLYVGIYPNVSDGIGVEPNDNGKNL